MVKVLVNFELPGHLRQRLLDEAGSKAQFVFADDDAAALRAIVDAEVVFGIVSPEIFAAARKLRWYQSSVASQERYMFPALIDSDVQLTNMAGIYNEEIADHVYALILGLTRLIPRFTRNQDRRYWEPHGQFKAEYLMGKTIGIIGLGGIGGEVAKRAPTFGMRVVATRAHPGRPKPEYVDQVWGPEGLDELLRISDIVVNCTPETPRTRKLIGRRELALMKRTARLINIGRGAVVDLTALTEALQSGAIAGAGLDVYEIEPLPADHPLWGLQTAILTPHMASVTDIYPARRVEVFLDNLGRYLRGETLHNLVDKEDWH